MTDKIRVGIIGTSGYADFMHLPALKSHPLAQITAICGRNRERAEEMAGKYAIPRVFTDYRAMIDQGGLDAVIIATTDDMHYPMTMAALDAGLHVLCEKPLARDMGQARAMLARAESAGVKHMTYFTHRWEPHIRYMVQLVDEGYVGRLYHARFSFLGNYALGPEYMWRWDRRYGLGALGDLGSHAIDLARLACGDIARVHALLATHVDRPAPDLTPYEPANDSAILTVQFKNGAQGSIHAGVVAQAWDQHISLSGESGTLDLDFNYSPPYALRGARPGGEGFQPLPIPQHLLGSMDPACPWFENMGRIFVEQPVGTHQFVDCILHDQPVTPSFADGAKVQAVIDAAFESDRSGCWVSVQ